MPSRAGRRVALLVLGWRVILMSLLAACGSSIDGSSMAHKATTPVGLLAGQPVFVSVTSN